MEFLLITVSFILALFLIRGWRRAILAAFYITAISAAFYSQQESEKVFTVTVKGESFQAKNVFKRNGIVRGVRLDTGQDFVVMGKVE